MRKPLNLLILAFLMLFQSLAMAQAPDISTPESSIAVFYKWFLHRSSERHGYALMDKDIYTYVSKPTVDFLRAEYKQNRFAEQAEYFTRVQDYDDQDWVAHTAVHPALLLNGVAVVPLTFGSTEKKTIIAFLRKQGNVWKITKVVDTEDDR
ncbi:DUF3828 domain-containing protein [Paraburkholderia sp. UYCP14C]|uniref:DUF3828 domain-containing protein n=1 Tax=Paraburkholderia sp. UYCP14C TaxID=2511130 RepID=UPI00102195B3|nr:DUF3828 domain-containing protein [Paraburkholderia sp. UYCP14C]RZF24924.1 DUF3828 domain-containing protein [Paraburkholderia sp. UYCP14C]